MTGTDMVRLQLDVTRFDLARFQPYVDRCRTSGIRLTTLSELGDTPRHRRALYELNKECSADIPGRGPFFAYDEYHRLRFEVPAYDPRGVVLALDSLDGDRWIGMAATSDRRRSGFVFNEMTGVRAPPPGPGHLRGHEDLRHRLRRDLRCEHRPYGAPPGQRARDRHEPDAGIRRRGPVNMCRPPHVEEEGAQGPDALAVLTPCRTGFGRARR